MRTILIILLLLALLACGDRKYKGNITEFVRKDTVGLSRELISKLIEYQQLYPLPTTKEMYVYIASFFKKGSDTLLLIWRSSEGVVAFEEQKLFGPYSDEKLYPTVIKDSKELYGRNFIIKQNYDSMKLNNFKPLKGHRYPESYPPNYTFLVKGNQLILNRIDTIWKHWD
jgi:hypothetical protein